MPDLRVLEYSGIATSATIDGAVSGTGDDASDPVVAVTTTTPDLMFAAVTAATGCTGVGGGYRVRVFDDHANTAQDLDATTPGTYSAGCHSAATQAWVAQVVAFRTAPTARRSPYAIRQTGEDESDRGYADLYGDQLAGDTMFVVVAWNEAGVTVTGVTDTAGNTYTPIVGFPGTYAGGTEVVAYYARDILAEPAGALARVTAAFTPPLSPGFYGGVYAIELAGVDRSAPFDGDAFQVCAGTTSCTSGMFATHFGPELLLTPDESSETMEAPLPGPGYGYMFLSSASSGSYTGTVVEFATESSPGTFETSYQNTAAADWLQSLFAFH